MSDLKPCPFCKGEFAFDFEIKKFRCDKCEATVLPDPYGRTVNTRPIEDDLRNRIAELEADNAKFRQLIRDWSIVLEQDDLFQLWHVEIVRQAMLEINKEREE